jgi:hypothetical protein
VLVMRKVRQVTINRRDRIRLREGFTVKGRPCKVVEFSQVIVKGQTLERGLIWIFFEIQ